MSATTKGTRATKQARRPFRAHTALFTLRYFSRYGGVLVAVVVLFGCEVAAMFQRGMEWRGDLVWTIDWLPVSFIVIGPVTSGLAALDTARTARGASHLARNPVHRTPAAAVATAYIIAIAVSHVACVIAALIVSAPPVGDPWAPLAALVQVLMLTFFICLGAGIGRFTKPVTAGFVGALIGLGVLYTMSSPGTHVTLLDFGGATVPRIGYAYSPSYLGWQALALILASAAFLIPRPLEGRRHLQITRRDSVIAIALIACVIVISSTIRGNRLKTVEAVPTLCGSAATIPTCFYPQHERVSQAFTEQFWILAEAARAKGYGAILPTAVMEASRSRLPQETDPTTGAFYVMPAHLQGATPSLWEIALGIVQPLHCPQLQREQPPSDRYWQDLGSLTATWVALANPPEARASSYPSGMSPARAATVITQFRDCTYPFN